MRSDDVAQSVEHVTVNHAVAGSNPAIVVFSEIFVKNLKAIVAEWFKAEGLRSSNESCVGSNPTDCKND